MWRLKELRVTVWDFGANKVLERMPLPSEALYIVCFNLAQELSQARLDYWLQLVRAAGTSDRQPPFLLVGSHVDKLSPDITNNLGIFFYFIFILYFFIFFYLLFIILIYFIYIFFYIFYNIFL